MFNCEDAAGFALDADLPIEGDWWKVGVIVGPSGSGKSSLGHELPGFEFYEADGWNPDEPIIDVIDRAGSVDDVTASLSAVGLGEVRAWLRPYPVLSTGQKFRADLARVLAEGRDHVVVDEFTSVVDRQIAKVGAQAFAKAWRRTTGQAVLLTCHYDVLDWLNPDWVFDTGSGRFTKGWPQRRPPIDVEIRRGGWQLWDYFKPYHYLDAGPMIGAKVYVAFIDGEPVAHLGMGTMSRATKYKGRVAHTVEARACRLVVLPEWQGAGLGMKFLNAVCEMQRVGDGVLDKRMTTMFHTSHPQLCAALRRDPKWVQKSAVLHGVDRRKSAESIRRTSQSANGGYGVGYGGHLRAVQGFRYLGPPRP